MTLEEYKKEVNKNIKSLFEKANKEEKELLNIIVNTINNLSEEKQELIDYLKEELKKLEINRMDFSIDYYVDRKAFLNEILSKIEKE